MINTKASYDSNVGLDNLWVWWDYRTANELSTIIIIIINEYVEAGLTASISIQHIYGRHKLQQKLY